MSSAALVKAKEALEKAREHTKALKAKGEESVGQLVSTGEVFGGSVAGGFLDEKMGVDEGDGVKVHKIQGVPTNLIAGLAGVMASFAGMFGKHSEHAYDLSKGVMAAYGANLGRSLAKKTETAAK